MSPAEYAVNFSSLKYKLSLKLNDLFQEDNM